MLKALKKLGDNFTGGGKMIAEKSFVINPADGFAVRSTSLIKYEVCLNLMVPYFISQCKFLWWRHLETGKFCC